VDDGTLRFILGNPSGGQNEPVVREGPSGMMDAAAQERQHWIAYGGKSSANTGSRSGPDTGRTGTSDDAGTLYRCGGA
jgi:hypothetical protein